MKFLAIIPARKNSKGIKNKNIKKFNGKPLIYWTIQAAKNSNCFDKIFVSTDSKIIQSFSQKQKVECPILRPKKLSGDNSNVHEAIKYTLRYYKKENYTPDAIVLLQPTSPLRDAKDIIKACDLFKLYKPDSLVSVVRVPHNFYPQNLYIKKDNELKQKSRNKKFHLRQNFKDLFARNGASIYITNINKISNYILGGKIIGYEMDLLKSIDINNLGEFEIAELIQKNYKFNY
jgi:CMP-N,N'-diacetyllegionaminic acid synthase